MSAKGVQTRTSSLGAARPLPLSDVASSFGLPQKQSDSGGDARRLGRAVLGDACQHFDAHMRVGSRQQHKMRVTRTIARGNTALAQAFEVEVEPDPITSDNVVPMSQRLSLLELTEATCHWPIGDPLSPDFFFCGGKVLTGLPYCAVTRASPISRPPI
jgi:hypothetical protein